MIYLHYQQQGQVEITLYYLHLNLEMKMLRVLFIGRCKLRWKKRFHTFFFLHLQHWAFENPDYVIIRSQRYKKVNAWCGRLFDWTVDPYFIQENFNKHVYLHILSIIVLPFLSTLNRKLSNNLFWQQSVCPAIFRSVY